MSACALSGFNSNLKIYNSSEHHRVCPKIQHLDNLHAINCKGHLYQHRFPLFTTQYLIFVPSRYVESWALLKVVSFPLPLYLKDEADMFVLLSKVSLQDAGE
jgi:hypothetical protein